MLLSYLTPPLLATTYSGVDAFQLSVVIQILGGISLDQRILYLRPGLQMVSAKGELLEAIHPRYKSVVSLRFASSCAGGTFHPHDGSLPKQCAEQ